MLQVLIVDDSLIMRKQIKGIIEELGHKVIAQAKNTQEAVHVHNKFRVDLVTMDITMPGEDGINGTKHLLAKDKSTKIIMITSHGQEDMVSDAIKAGAVGYVLKPITIDKISEAINKVFKNA